jgi:hypothetical protein
VFAAWLDPEFGALDAPGRGCNGYGEVDARVGGRWIAPGGNPEHTGSIWSSNAQLLSFT